MRQTREYIVSPSYPKVQTAGNALSRCTELLSNYENAIRRWQRSPMELMRPIWHSPMP